MQGQGEKRQIQVRQWREAGAQARKEGRAQTRRHGGRRQASNGSGGAWSSKWLFYPCEPATVGGSAVLFSWTVCKGTGGMPRAQVTALVQVSRP